MQCKIKHSMTEKKVGENDEERLTNDIEVFKWGKMISQSEIKNTDK